MGKKFDKPTPCPKCGEPRQWRQRNNHARASFCTPCKTVYERMRRANNPEMYKRIALAHRLKNKDRIAAAIKEYNKISSDRREKEFNVRGLSSVKNLETVKGAHERYQKWSEADVESLLRLDDLGYQRVDIAKMLGRTYRGVNRKMHSLRMQEIAYDRANEGNHSATGNCCKYSD